jgi:hypothetical protein
MIVLLAAFDSFDTISKSQAYQADRTQNLDDMRGVLNRMTKDLRQATSVDEAASTASTITFTTYIDGVVTPVVYTASGNTLTRKVGTNNAFVVLDNLANTDVFTYVAATDVTGVQWVEIELQVHPARSPDTTLVLQSEVNLRNRTAALNGES